MKVVYDLDGTLIPFNTFKAWIVFSVFVALLFLRISDFLSISGLVKQRITSSLSREEFKRLLHEHQYRSKFWIRMGDVFSVVLRLCLRRELLTSVEYKTACLATAAPDIYVLPLAQRIGTFVCVICSHVGPRGYVETIGEQKRDMVRERFCAQPDVLFTDHFDDAPLARSVRTIVVVSPSRICRKAFIDEFGLKGTLRFVGKGL